MAALLIDSNVIVDTLRGKKQPLTFFQTTTSSLHISTITQMEIITGSRNNREKTHFQHLLTSLKLTPIPITPAINHLAIHILDQLHSSTNIGIPYSLIAATAIENNLKLITLNTKHFRQIPHLKLQKPY